MKYLILILCSAIVAPLSFAQETTVLSYEDNLIEALHYRSPQGSIYGGLSFATHLHDTDAVTNSSTGAARSNNTHTANSMGANAEYGISDKFLIGLSWNYLLHAGNEDTSATTGIISSSSANGLSDPTLHTSYRYYGDLKGRFFASGFANLTEALGTYKVANSTQDGNNSDAASVFDFGTNLYWVHGVHEWLLGATIAYHTVGKYSPGTLNGDYTADPFWHSSLTGTYRWHFHPAFYADVTATLVAPVNIEFHHDDATPSFNSAEHVSAYVSPGLLVGWKLSERTLFHALYSISTYDVSDTPDTGIATNNHHSHGILTLGANSTF